MASCCCCCFCCCCCCCWCLPIGDSSLAKALYGPERLVERAKMVAANPEKVPQKSREKETNEFLCDEPLWDNSPSSIICICRHYSSNVNKSNQQDKSDSSFICLFGDYPWAGDVDSNLIIQWFFEFVNSCCTGWLFSGRFIKSFNVNLFISNSIGFRKEIWGSGSSDLNIIV